MHDRGRHPQGVGELPDLRLVKVPNRVEGTRHVAVDRAIAEEEFGLVAGPDHQPPEDRGLVVENRHPLTRHLVAPTPLLGVREAFEVGVDLRGDVDLQPVDAQLRHDLQGVAPALWVAGFVRHDDGQHIPWPERLARQGRDQAGIDPAAQAEYDPLEADLLHFVLDETHEDFPHQLRVDGKRREDGLSKACGCAHAMPVAFH